MTDRLEFFCVSLFGDLMDVYGFIIKNEPLPLPRNNEYFYFTFVLFFTESKIHYC